MPLTDPQAVVDKVAKGRRVTTAWMLCANMVVAVLLAAMLVLVLCQSHQAVEDQARSVADGMAAVAQLNVQGEIGRIDAVIRATTSELERLLSGPTRVGDETVDALLRTRFDLIEGIEAIRLTDADGQVRWGTGLAAAPPTSVADRDYFLEARGLSEPRTFSAGPLVSRTSRHWIVAFIRPVHVQGRFAGVLYISVGTDHFRSMLERYALGPRDAVSLRRDDHRMVARYSPGSTPHAQVGDAFVSAQLVQAMERNPRSGIFVSSVPIDGESRTTAYRALDGWPFVVYAGISNERFFRPWRLQMTIAVALAVSVQILVMVASWLVTRAYRRGDIAMQALADQGKRVQALLRTAGDGIHITDQHGRLIEMSDSFAEMLRSSRQNLLGRHISSWDANQDEDAIATWLAKLKPGDRQRVDVQHRRDDGQLIDVELQLSVAEVGGALLVFSSARDVTTERRLMREQTAMLNSDLVGMVKIENRIITWRNLAVERILGYEPGELQDQPARRVYWDDADYVRVGIEGYAAVTEHGHYRSQIKMRRKTGEPVWIDFGAVPLTRTELFAMLVDITAMKVAHENLTHAAFHDALTQLPNRLLLDDRINQALATARRERKNVAICYLDLDGFKAINDQHGHDAGDQLLQTIADRLRTGIRPSDSAIRIGGDEFVLVIASVDGDGWKPILERVMLSIREPVVLSSDTVVNVVATAGVALVGPHETSGSRDQVEQADHAMLRGKRMIKGQIYLA